MKVFQQAKNKPLKFQNKWNLFYLCIKNGILDLLRKDKLLKLRKKNRGNIQLLKAIDKLIDDIETSDWNNKFDILKKRPDADRVHGDNFYFFDISIHRTMIMIMFHEQEAEILWVGNHDEYDATFRGNKVTIETWIRNQGKIK